MYNSYIRSGYKITKTDRKVSILEGEVRISWSFFSNS